MKNNTNNNLRLIILILLLFIGGMFTNQLKIVASNQNVAEVNSIQYEEYEEAWEEALASGKEITMLADWTIDSVLTVESNKKITLNMNGYMINRGKSSSSRSGQVFLVEESANLNINGGGSQEHKGNILSTGLWYSNENGENIITGSLITGGYNSNGGGAIHIEENATVTLNQVSVAGNASSDSDGGGAIRLEGSDSTLKLNDSSILYNYTSSGGGAGIRLEGSNSYVEVNNSCIMYNSTNGNNSDGGGIQINNGKVSVTNNSEISYNTATRNGGGVYIGNGDFISDNSVIISYNNASIDGGGVFVKAEADEVILSGKFVGNTAKEEGGAIYVNHSQITKVKESKFYGNIARTYGGAIYLESNVSISLEDSINMSGNTPNSLYLTNANNLSNITLDENSLIGIDTSFDTSIDNPLRVGVGNLSYFSSNKFGYELEETSFNGIYFAKQEVTSVPNSYIVNGYGYELKQGPFVYKGKNAGNLKSKYFYSDGFFAGSSSMYNEHLSTMSINFALAAMNKELGDIPYNEELAAENVVNLLQDLGFSKFYVHYPEPEFYGIDADIISTIGYIIGSKTINIYGKKVTLIAIAVRGGGYGVEWASNVILGDGVGEAKGFKDAADQVEKGVYEYISTYNIDTSNSKFWATGFSRAAATANLLSKRLTDKYGTEKVYSYCFETPKGGVKNLVEKGSDYSNIHNIVSTSDVVPMLGTTEMGFIRYGIDHIVPAHIVGSSEYNELKNIMLSQLSVMNENISFDDSYHAATLEYFDSYMFGSDLISKIEWEYSTAEDFIPFFIKDIQERSLTDKSKENEFNKDSVNWKGYRHYYSSYNWYLGNEDGNLKIISYGTAPSDYASNKDKYIKLTFEQAIVNLMELFYSMDSVVQDAIMSNIDIETLKSDLGMYDVWTEVIDEWEHLSLKNKNSWLIKIWNALKIDTISDDLLSSEDKIKIKNSLYVVLDVLLDIVAEDYEYNDQNGIGTLVFNMSGILQTHYHDVVAAWLRGYDSFYAVDYVAPPFAPTPSINEGIYNESLEVELISKDNTKIYYTIDGTIPVVGKKNTYEYNGSINLQLMDSNVKMYVINAIAVENEIKSDVVTLYYYISDTNDFTTEFIVSDITYGEDIIANVDSKFGDVIYLYSDTIDGKFSSKVPSEPGVYYVKAKVEETIYYEQIETEVKQFEIKKIEINLSDLNWNENSFVYDGTCKVVILEGITIDPNIIEITYENNENIVVGNYETVANITLLDTEHYRLINVPNLTHNWSINEATNEFIADVDILDWEYGEQANTPVGEAKFGDIVFIYSSTIDGEYSEAIPTIPGTYYVKGYVVGTNDYLELYSEPIAFEIHKNNNNFVMDLTISDYIYGKTPSIEVDSLYGDVIVVYSQSIDGEYSISVPVNAGTYYAKAVVEETMYYTGLESEPIEFKILKDENIFIDSLSINSWTYGENASNPSASAKYGEVIFMYSTNLDGEYSDIKPTNAGVYYVKAIVLENNNYSGIESIEQFEIYKADPKVNVPSNLNAKLGDNLSSVKLPENWSWNDSTIVLDETGKIQLKATYTPEDINNYNVIEMLIEVNVEEKTETNNIVIFVVISSTIIIVVTTSAVFLLKKKRKKI